ncbi:Latrophilin Cytoplasmic C-terminal region [Desmophyllum pertusum]|uniref:Latrophilin Cytoplasmic C-terminal region n=1 Tax=Desmophyllum pertusum TaxID=174260 RepID=A0A9W9ZBL9_9CNID|nr:Latrophilin Cytoplasmic C-terminal region [Desmophyllum pertusum]
MATEGIILYLMIVKVFPTSSEGPRKRIFFVCSWGIPYYPRGYNYPYRSRGLHKPIEHCWLSVADGFIWSFVGPVLLICVVNLVFLGMTFKAMASRSTSQPSRNPPQMRYWAKACAVLTCLLGTTWLLGLFFLGKASVVMAYLFNIFKRLAGTFHLHFSLLSR